MREEVIIGERYRARLAPALEQLGLGVFWMEDNPAVDERLAGHADLSLLRLGEGKIVVSSHCSESPLLVKYLTNRGLSVIQASKEQGSRYPEDINLCACVLGKHMIHHPRYTDPAIWAIAQESNLKIIPVKQGYSRCAVCPVNENSIITADNGIARAAQHAGLCVLKISQRNIALPGFPYGFIGGASITLKESVIFTGDIQAIPEWREIMRFVEMRGKQVHFLSEDPIFDIGGGVVV